jgi:O-antigen/teichoic acid export membrane protein
LPVDALFLDQPYRAAADQLDVGTPQNPLLTDLILENYAWKQFLKDAVRTRQLPLWDPFLFAGHPFLANGQHSGLYPLSVIFYLIPLWRAFGLFAWLQLALAGWWAYLFARTLGVGRLGALLSGIVFQLSGFMVVSVVHPMIVAAASWLPFIMAMMERVLRQRPALGDRPATLPWALLGAIGLGCQMLAGHAENTYFVLLVMALYAAWRLVGTGLAERRVPVRALVWLAILVILGLALGTVQFLPLYEVVADSFRSGEMAASLAQVRGWAYPPRRLITFGIPNFFGSPAHHGHFDLFQWRWVPATTNAQGAPILSHDWGIKNYVEGGAYLGLMPLFLAVIAVLGWLVPRIRRWVGRAPAEDGLSSTARTTIPFFTLLSLFSLGCIFGTPLYAIVYVLPFLSQSHSPFRWVFPLTLSVAILAGFGIDAVRRRRRVREDGPRSTILRLLLLDTAPSLVSGLAALAFWSGVLTLLGLILSRVFFGQIEPLVEQVFWGLAKAPQAFADHRAFYSYEFKWIGLFSSLLMATGIVLRVSRCPIFVRRRPIWEFLAVGVLALDLLAFGAGFNPAVNPGLLNYTPPVVEFLRRDTSVWRYATFTPPGTTKTMNANVGMFYDLQTVAGYDSLFSRQYADYMALIEEQDQLQFNRIASFSEWSSLDSPLTDLLNVKYVITEVEIPNEAKYELVYQDPAVRVYENRAVIPRAFTLPTSAAVVTDDVEEALRTYDPHQFVVLEAWGGAGQGDAPQPATLAPQSVTSYDINEVFVDAQVDEVSWLVLTDSYFAGWRAFVRPQGAGEDQEQEVAIARVDGTFRGVRLEPGAWTVRFKYSPNSVKIGAFISFIAGMTILFLAGLYLWRFFYREEDDASTVRRVAKNSIAPIVLNLFNRSIDFAGAALMARILGPVGTGKYMTAISIYLWFDILANFGLDMYLMREVARDRSRARRLFLTTTALRLLLYLVVVPLLVGFLVGWQALGSTLASETVWAVVLLYAALLPGSVAYGLAALFRGCERHEIPAAIQTVTTIIKVTLWVPVLVGGLGVVGVAGAAVVTNVATLVILGVLAGRLVWPDLSSVETAVDWSLTRPMLVESWPLMASLLLQALFPGMNVLLLQSLQGDLLVGWYDAARKWVDALNIVPQFFTFAVFPVMSRLADEDQNSLRRSYGLSVKLLTLVALPAAVLMTLLATPLVGLLSGSRFLPHGAIALRLLVWSILFGWVNSLTNYVLIALNRQRYVLLASGTRVVFTVLANLLFVPRFSYLASTWIIIGGEGLLAVLFYIDLRRHLGSVAWVRMLGRPLLAGLAMGAVAWALASFSLPLAILASVLTYGGALILLKAVSPEEWEMLAPLIPAPVRRFVA